MTEASDEYRKLVEQKMEARAERHVRENLAEQAEQAREVHAAAETLARVARTRQQHLAQLRRQEEIAIARRSRPLLIVQFRSDPAGIRHALTLREVCLNCGSESARSPANIVPRVYCCPDCSATWSAGPCWSCATGLLDTRDPETPRCQTCGWTKCAVCGACNPKGCPTNPYSANHRQRDEVIA